MYNYGQIAFADLSTSIQLKKSLSNVCYRNQIKTRTAKPGLIAILSNSTHLVYKALAKRTRKSTQVLDLRFVWPPTCVDFGRAQIWTQVDANEFFFFNRLATQRKSTQVDRK